MGKSCELDLGRLAKGVDFQSDMSRAGFEALLELQARRPRYKTLGPISQVGAAPAQSERAGRR